MSSVLVLDRIPILASVDVLVAGAGSAGCCAALAAREDRARSVLLVERYGFAGGSSTGVLDTFYGFFTPGERPKKVAGGIPDRVVNGLDSYGQILLRANTYGAGTGVTYNPEHLKRVWDELLQKAGVRVLHHALIVDTLRDAGGRITGVAIATKSGFFRVLAKRVIDASGDADVCHLAEVPYEKAGDLDPAQTLTTTFRMCNVDLERFEKSGGKKMLNERMAEAVEKATHPLPRKKGSAHEMVLQHCIATVAVRVADVDATNVEQLSAAEVEGRRQAFVYEKFLRDRVPGYEGARIVGLAHQIGVRETRRVFGEYRLTREDCMSAKRFDDRVLLCGAPIEDHRQGKNGEEETAWAYVPEGGVYDVPYRTLVPKGRNEVWTVGRCFSATHDAHASCRSMAQTMSMGQAAGLAAVLSLDADCGARDVSIPALQSRLQVLGAVLEEPKKIANTSKDGWGEN